MRRTHVRLRAKSKNKTQSFTILKQMRLKTSGCLKGTCASWHASQAHGSQANLSQICMRRQNREKEMEGRICILAARRRFGKNEIGVSELNFRATIDI